MNKASTRTGAKLPAHFANAVFVEDTGQMLDYKKLINHNKKETREWWQQSSANEFGRLMKGAGRNKDGTQRVTGSDTQEKRTKRKEDNIRPILLRCKTTER